MRHGVDCACLGIDCLQLVPTKRGRHLCADARPGAPGAEHVFMRCVLIEVDEDTLASFFLPPLVGNEVGVAFRQFSAERDNSAANRE